MRSSRHRWYLSLLALAALLVSGGCKEATGPTPEGETTDPDLEPAATTTLSFGVYTADKPIDVVRQFRPMLDILEEKITQEAETPISIKLDISATYDEGIDAIANGKASFARLGPASYVTAKAKNPGLEVLAMEAKAGNKVFHGIIAVQADSEIRSIGDLRGRSFAFGDELSTIGRFLSQDLLAQAGIHASDLSRYEYLGRHDAVGAAVGAGEFDAGALKESTFKSLVEAGTPIRELTRFENVTKPWLIHPSVDPGLRLAVRNALLKTTDVDALQALGAKGFVGGEDADFAPTRAAMQRNSRFFQ